MLRKQTEIAVDQVSKPASILEYTFEPIASLDFPESELVSASLVAQNTVAFTFACGAEAVVDTRHLCAPPRRRKENTRRVFSLDRALHTYQASNATIARG